MFQCLFHSFHIHFSLSLIFLLIISFNSAFSIFTLSHWLFTAIFFLFSISSVDFQYFLLSLEFPFAFHVISAASLIRVANLLFIFSMLFLSFHKAWNLFLISTWNLGWFVFLPYQNMLSFTELFLFENQILLCKLPFCDCFLNGLCLL